MKTSTLFLIAVCCLSTPVWAGAPDIMGNQLPSPVTFLQNKGQWEPGILYQGNSTAVHVFFLKDGLSFAQSGEEVENEDGTEDYPFIVWNMKFMNPHPALSVTGYGMKESKISYLYGKDSSKWVIRPPEFTKLEYSNIYDHIDLEFYGSGNDLKYDYIVHPGGKLNSINAYYEGVEHLSVNASGELNIHTLWNTQVQRTPVAWQIINGQKNFVDINYNLINDTTFGFVALNGFDKNYDLIIDPLFQMVWSSYTQATGASNNINYCFSNAMDRDGNVYLTGMVDGTFPVTPGAYSGPGSVVPEIFVAKFSSDGTTLLYSTYLPGNSSEHGVDIAVDDSGRAYVTGVIDLNITGVTNYPSTPNAYQPVHSSGSDAFLTVLNPAGTGLVYSTFLGGTGGELGFGLALGPPGIAYVTGYTSIGNFPVVASNPFPTGDNDLFVAKFDIDQSGSNSLIYSTRIGGGSFSNIHGRSIAVNSAGNAFVTGTVFSSFGSPVFPVTPGAYNSVYNTGQDGIMSFVLKLSATTPVSLEYATFLAPGTASSIAVDNATDEAVIVGSTRTFAFPTTAGSLQPVHGQDALGNPNDDAFVVRMNAAGNGLVYSTFLGGQYSDVGTGVALNSLGEAYVVGISQDSFPTSPGSYQPGNAGTYDFFIVNLNANGTAYGCGGSTYVGGSDADYSGSFYDYASPHVSIMDHGGSNDTICVSSTSHSQDFPTTPGVYGPVKVNGIADQPVFFKLTCVPTAAAPIANFNQSITTSCSVDAVVDFTDATLNNPVTWQWSFPGGLPATSTLQHPQDIIYTLSGTYNVTLIACNTMGCDTITNSIQIIIPQNLTVNLGNDTLVCNGNPVVLTAPSGNIGYSWELNGAPIGGSTSTLTALQSGTYSVLVTDSSGCTGTDTVNVAMSNPVVSIGTDVALCNIDSLEVNATPGFQVYQWLFNGAVIPFTGDSVYVNQQGSYVVVVTDSVGCIASDTIQVVISNPSVNLGPDIDSCNIDSVSITATPGFNGYQWWYNGTVISATGDTIYAGLTGSYSVIVTDSVGCTASDTIGVTVSNPLVSIGSDVVLCNIDSLEVNATPGFPVYQWLFNGTVIPFTGDSVYVNQQGSYVVVVTDSNGCNASDTINVTIGTISVVLINDTTFCEGDSVIIDAGPGFSTYEWQLNGNPLSASNSITATQSGSYSLLVTDAQGCTAVDTVTVTVYPMPNIQTIADITICMGDSITLFTTGAVNYQWSPATYLSSSTIPSPVAAPLSDITYTVTGTNSNGCTASDEISIQVNELPRAAFEYAIDYSCSGILLTTQNKSTDAIQYIWNFGDGLTSTETNPVHYYNTLQNQTIQLIALNGNCADTISFSNISFNVPLFDSIPNIFSPNNDGLNDCFTIPGIERMNGCFDLKVFNRWGSKVYNNNNSQQCWDGRSTGGEELPSAVYFYIITIGKTKYEGTVHLLR